jgi:O-antigen/teichoic acid export membrane protein
MSQFPTQKLELQRFLSGWQSNLPVRQIRALAKDSFWTALGNIAVFLSQAAIFILLAKLTSTEIVGQYALALGIATPVFMFAGLQLRQVLLSDVQRNINIIDALCLRIAAITIASLVAIGIAFACELPLAVRMTIFLLICRLAIESLIEFSNTVVQMAENYRSVGINQIIRSMLVILCGALAIFQLRTSYAAALGAAIGSAAGLLLESPVVAAITSRSTSLGMLETQSRTASAVLTCIQLFGRCLPLGLVMLLIGLLHNIPRFYLHSFRGESQVGIYSSLGFVTTGGTLIISAICYSSLQRLAVYYTNGDMSGFRQLLKLLIVTTFTIGILILTVAAFAGRWILDIAFGKEYSQHSDILLWLIGAGIIAFVTSATGTAVTASQKYYIQVAVVGSTVLVSAGGCFLLVPKYGLHGAAWANLIAWAFCGFTYYRLIPRRINTNVIS